MKQHNGLNLTRRTILRGAVAGTVAGGSLSAFGTAAAQSSIDEWLEDTDNYDGTVEDHRGEEEVQIEVGAGAGGLLFGPAAIRVDPGTTVIWEWTGQGGSHNVHAMSGGDFQSETIDDEGHTYPQTLEEPGIITYQCDPHATIGMKGVVVVGDMPVGETNVRPDWGNWFTDEPAGGEVGNYDGTVTDLRGENEVTIGVGTEGNGGAFAFGPPAVWIDSGTTVKFEWTGEGGDHNVVSEEGPTELDSGQPLQDAGVHFEYTFEESGIYKYYCDPHLSLGMKGAIAVGDVPTVEIEPEEPKDEEGSGFVFPGGDPGAALAITWFGIMGIAVFAVLATEFRQLIAVESPTAEDEQVRVDDGVVREIDHEEFDPVGTASLIALYFLILVGLWVFMYFVEFLGNGPTIIG